MSVCKCFVIFAFSNLRLQMYSPKFFTLPELLTSSTADKKRINNAPSFAVVENLNKLCQLVLDPARAELNAPITVTSGFRCRALNVAVGGVSNSQHLTGCAADLQCKDLQRLFDILKRNPNIDQLLFERSKNSTWLHVSISVADKPRHIINNNYIVK